MARYADRQALADKAEWEGGIEGLIFDYGLHADDLPEDDDELLEAFIALDLQAFRRKLRLFEDLLPDGSPQ